MKSLLLSAGLCIFAVVPAQSATAGSIDSEPARQAQSSPVELSVVIHLLDLLRIDDAEQTAFVDFALWVSWRDESLASPGSPVRFFRTNQVWVPNLQIMNSLTLTNRRVDVVEVDEDGNAHYRRRLVGTISVPRDLSDFPVDEHQMRLFVVAAGMNRDVELVIDERLTGQSESFSIPEWEVGAGGAEISEFVAAGEHFPALSYEWQVRRKIGYYIWKVIIPLAMVVMMSWAVFWLDPKQAGPQIGIAATSILTLIAYRFTLGFLVPRLSYLTRLDLFITGASLLVFVALVEALATVSLAEEHPTLARRIDINSRWVFPAAFAALTAVSFML
jgi:hypothetical protein